MRASRLAGGPARLALVTGLVAVVLLAGRLTASGAAPVASAAPAVPVTAASVVCPAAPVSAGTAGDGATRLRTGATRAALTDRPAAAVTAVRGLDATVVSASGVAAGGLSAEHARRVDDGARRGLVAVRCAAPTATTWFVGGSTTAGSTTELLLVEVDGAPAGVDVRAWSATGPVDPRPGRAVPVPAGGRVRLPLDRLGPDRDLLALQVTTTRGRVAAFLEHSRADGRTPLGLAQVPAVSGPAHDLVVPGLPAGPGRRAVVVTNPGSRDLGVQVVLTTSDGELPPREVAVPAGTSVRADVSAALAGTPAAARVRSPDGAVLAAGLVEDGPDGGVQDVAWVGASGALRAPALLPEVAPGERLLLSATGTDAVVQIVPVGSAGRGERVAVVGGTTTSVVLEGGPVEVRPVSGRVHAARYRAAQDPTGPWTASLPVVGAAPAAGRPRVVADPLLRER